MYFCVTNNVYVSEASRNINIGPTYITLNEFKTNCKNSESNKYNNIAECEPRPPPPPTGTAPSPRPSDITPSMIYQKLSRSLIFVDTLLRGKFK